MVSTSGPSQRPGLVTGISVILAVLAMAGFGNAVVWNQPDVIAAASKVGLRVGGLEHTSISIIGALAALVSSVGLWRMASWARPAFITWCVTFVAFNAWVIHSGNLRAATPAGAGLFLALSVVVLGGLYSVLAQALRWTWHSSNRGKAS